MTASSLQRSSRRLSARRFGSSGCAGTSTAGGACRPAAMYDVKAGIDASGNIVEHKLDASYEANRYLADDDERARRIWHLARRRSSWRPRYVGHDLQGVDDREKTMYLPESQPQYHGAFKRLRAPLPRGPAVALRQASRSSTKLATQPGWIRLRSVGSTSTARRSSVSGGSEFWTQSPRSRAGSRESQQSKVQVGQRRD